MALIDRVPDAGKFHPAADAGALIRSFVNIAQTGTTSLIDPILARLSERLGKMITDRIMVDHS